MEMTTIRVKMTKTAITAWLKQILTKVFIKKIKIQSIQSVRKLTYMPMQTVSTLM